VTQKKLNDIPTRNTSVGPSCVGSLLVIEISSVVTPCLIGAYWTITVAAEPGAIERAPAPLRIENGGSCLGWPTVTCKVALPVFLIVMLWRSVDPGTASKNKRGGDTAM